MHLVKTSMAQEAFEQRPGASEVELYALRSPGNGIVDDATQTKTAVAAAVAFINAHRRGRM